MSSRHFSQGPLISKIVFRLHFNFPSQWWKVKVSSEKISTLWIEKHDMNHGLVLYEYQEGGVKWMLERERCTRHKAGLLLDECGLGKTPQMCATLMRNPQPNTLLVLPVNLISQWKAALKQWAPHFRVAVFHGADVPAWDGRATMHGYFSFVANHQGGGGAVGPLVVMTSYGKVVDRKFEKRRRRLKKAGKLQDPHQVGVTLLHRMVWDRIVLDEAHVIRNRLTIRTRYVLALRGTIKWALTATPIHNGIQDYQCLLQYLGLSEMEILRLFASHPVLENYLTDTARLLVSGKTVHLDQEEKRAGPSIRHEEITLRRTKKVLQQKRPREEEDECDARKLHKTLPPLHVNIVCVTCATAEEQQFYRNLERATRIELLRFEAEDPQRGVPEVREQFMFELLLRMRQASVNPRLVLTGYKRKFSGVFPMQLLIGSVSPTMLRARTRRDIDSAERHFLERVGVPSKTRALAHMIKRHRGEKAIVFCEFSEEMPHLRTDLQAHGLSCVLYNGSMSCAARDKVVQFLSWTNEVTRNVLESGFFGAPCHVPWEIVEHIARLVSFDVVLIQISSGNAGLNLQMCSRVYFTQPSWNPCIEEQAIGRAHRCGQERDVHAVKLVGVTRNADGSPGATIDNRILEVQVAKRKVTSAILGDEGVLFNGHLTSASEYGMSSKLSGDEMRNLILGNDE